MANFNIEYLVVAGGGAGGNGMGAGGGAGGLIHNYGGTPLTLNTGNPYTVTIGDGAIGSTSNFTVNGNNSVFDNLTAIGGGGGSSLQMQRNGGSTTGADGGSGGGSGASDPGSYSGGAALQPSSSSGGFGNAGGDQNGSQGTYPGAGGGGAGTAGQSAPSSSGIDGGDGGVGIQIDIDGNNYYWAAGGGGNGHGSGKTGGNGGLGGGGAGSNYSGAFGLGGGNAINNGSNGSTGNSQPGGNAGVNTGSGGGGAAWEFGSGGNGGSGIVILRYLTADIASYTTTGITPTEDTTTISGQTILSFTTVGTGTITFTSSTPTGTITKITNPELFNLGASTSATQLPVITTAQRIAMTGLSVGEMIFNSDTDKVEYWDGTKWYGITYEVTAESPYNNVLYTGSGNTTSGQSITGIGFKPDLVWFKSTGTTYNNVLYDSIRGTNAAISTNLSTGIYNNYNRLQSFDNDGFTIKANNTADLWKIDRSGQPFVAWCFKAGGAAVTNTDGNITVNVSANPDAGFSVVTGNVGSGAKTFGTGLNQAPELVIGIPLVASTGGWGVWFKDWTTYQYAQINTYAATSTAGVDLWNLSNWNTSGLMGVTSSLWGTNNNFVHYCFHSVAGYSKVGSYTGNGTTGQLITTDFQPRFLLVKCSSSGLSYHDWYIFDDKRTPSNPSDAYLKANKSDSEVQSLTYNPTFESTGFRWEPGDSSGGWNGSGFTYIYMAFA